MTKQNGEIESKEVRACIERVLPDDVLAHLFGQHTLWQIMSDPSKLMEPDDYYKAARDGDNWKRKTREKNFRPFQGLPPGTTGWKRTYVNRVISDLEPKVSLYIYTSQDEKQVYRVEFATTPYNAQEPKIRVVPVEDAFPNRVSNR